MRGKSLLWFSLIALLFGGIAPAIHVNPAFATSSTTYLYVDSFTPIHTDWTPVGISPYLHAVGDGNYIEGNDHCQLIGVFGFDDIILGAYDIIVDVSLEGCTLVDSTDIDIDVYGRVTSSWLWVGSLWGDPFWDWKSPRGTTQMVSDIVPATKTQPGLSAFEVMFHYWTGSGTGLGNALIDAVRLKVTIETGVPRTVEKTLSSPDGELGDIVHVTINVNIPLSDWGVDIVDTLPPELNYVAGSFTVNTVSYTPLVTVGGSPPQQQIEYFLTPPPTTYIIEFDVKVVSAYSADRTVLNKVNGTWIDEYGTVINIDDDIVEFTIHPFEELHKNVGIQKADVVFAIDITGSMTGILNVVKNQATNIMNSLAIQIFDVQFGLISFMDYNGTYTTTAPSGSLPTTYYSQYGDASYGDTPYRLDQSITNSITTMANKINGLAPGMGGDQFEDYTRIIYESYHDAAVGWRTGAKRILILFGDNPPHDTDFDYNGDGQADNTGGDPGPNEILGDSDDLDFQTEVTNAANQGVHILAVYNGAYNYRYPWEYMASETNGGFYHVAEASRIPDAIKLLIKEQAEEASSPIKVGTNFQWAIVMDIVNPFDFTMTSVVITTKFGVQIEIDPLFPYSITQGTVSYTTRGKTQRVFLTWNIGDLPPGETARLRMLVSTDYKPGRGDCNEDNMVDIADLSYLSAHWTGPPEGPLSYDTNADINNDGLVNMADLAILSSVWGQPTKGMQEYTTPGIYEMSSEAKLKFIDPTTNLRLNAVTPPISIVVLPAEDP